MSDVEMVGELAIGPALAVDQLPERPGLVEGLEVLAEGVLHQLVLQDLILGHRPLGFDTRERRQAGQERGPIPALTDNNHPSARSLVPPYPDRLELPAFLHAG